MAEYSFPDSCIQIFAKAPLIGEVKTRLQPELSLQHSLGLHRNMVYHCLQQACESALAPVELWVTADHEYWGQLGQQLDFRLCLQAGDDLGQRMAHAVESGLASHNSVLLMGTDCPFIDVPYLGAALGAVTGDTPVVVGPALDGGYVLLAVSQFDASLFDGIAWGGETVLASTLERVGELGWPCLQLASLRDIDRPSDILALKMHFPHLIPTAS